ncbi:uncharacterized protein LY89DRAFT_507830 [Mollisia scopiformis]|uniref:2EXR domain-containing protein n=1 Tax=Mollisia scopiformis TaxID=149040 RepID=A0A194XFK7_MOLSC|nr:uncharacterized protein LY89DRAFT_507830 [Mollisia scopiformis]KUJ18919.1 hypothetical protein LY89DRAFT_507830 [Mollisia scopiformis]
MPPSWNLTSGPLEKFEFFPRLPVEIQLQIFRHASCVPRIIEVEKLCCNNLRHRRGNGYRIAAKSRKIPPILQVSRASRAEAEKFYAKRFVSQKRKQQTQYIWFNNDFDILLFGKDTDALMMTHVFRDEVGFSNVAYLIGDQDVDPRYVFPSSIMGALHGCLQHDGLLGRPYFQPGCQGLKNVFLVLRSDVWDVPHGEVDANVTFRTPRLEGRSENAIATRSRFESILKECTSGNGLDHWARSNGYRLSAEQEKTGIMVENKWTSADEMPQFHFVNFAPMTTIQRPEILDGVVLCRYFYDCLIRNLDETA